MKQFVNDKNGKDEKPLIDGDSRGSSSSGEHSQDEEKKGSQEDSQNYNIFERPLESSKSEDEIGNSGSSDSGTGTIDAEPFHFFNKDSPTKSIPAVAV